VAITVIERFQQLQVELVRAGFATVLSARPEHEQALVEMRVDLRGQTAAALERLDALALAGGFAFTVGKDSDAMLTLTEA
jgi:hypothetical protein